MMPRHRRLQPKLRADAVNSAGARALSTVRWTYQKSARLMKRGNFVRRSDPAVITGVCSTLMKTDGCTLHGDVRKFPQFIGNATSERQAASEEDGARFVLEALNLPQGLADVIREKLRDNLKGLSRMPEVGVLQHFTLFFLVAQGDALQSGLLRNFQQGFFR